MIAAVEPARESERLAALRSYAILDTPPEQAFDELVDLAAHICEAPIALISLIDEERQWFKARTGLEARETARSMAFCAHAILQPEIFIVEDATRDARFAANPLVTADPKIRFYAGAPLITPEGHALGTLCVIDRQPRALAPDHQRAMRILSRHLMALLELRRKSIEADRLRAERDLLDARLADEERAIECRVGRRAAARKGEEGDSEGRLAIAEESRRTLLKALREQRRAQREAARRGEVLESIIHAIPDLFLLMEADGTIRDCRARSEARPCLPPDACPGKRMGEVLPQAVAARFLDGMHAARRSGELVRFEYELRTAEGVRHCEARLSPIEESSQIVALVQDIGQRKREEQVQLLRNRVLDQIIARRALPVILEDIARRFELIEAGIVVSILLVEAGDTLGIGAAPSLPADCRRAIAGHAIGSGQGACVRAAASGEAVIIEDIGSHPDCAPFRALAAAAGLRACWSYPFKDPVGKVLGTFAAYAHQAGRPSPQQAALIGELARLAGIAVQRVGEEAARQDAEDELRLRERGLEMAVGSALELLRANEQDVAIGHVLETLVEWTGVERVSIFELRDEGKCADVSVVGRHDRRAAGAAARPRAADALEAALLERCEGWRATLAAGGNAEARAGAFPARERALLEGCGALSLLRVPIMLEERLWGVLAFDSSDRERRWSAAEEGVLRIIAACLGSAIARKRSLADLRQAAAVFENAQEGVILTDLAGHMLAVNPAFSEITGYSAGECLGETPRLLNSGRQDREFFRGMWASLSATGRWQGEIWNRCKDGSVCPQLLTISAIRDARAEPTGYVAVLTDISQIKQGQARLEHLAHYDPLTELPNRLTLASHLAHALRSAERSAERVAVLFIDLDQFKMVNDSLGHAVGDELLSAVSRRLEARLREEDTLGRLGGDEFLLLIEHIRRPEDAAVVARDVIAALETPFELRGGHQVYIRASIGISLFPDDGASVDELVRNADAAMYRAKNDGRNTYGFYTEDLTHAASARLLLETRLRQALERDEFELHYQPLVALDDGRVIGAEALIRWRPPGEAMVPPDAFIPLAEETGLIVDIGEWVLHAACGQAQAWIDAGAPLETISVNVSPRQFRRPGLRRQLDAALASSGLAATKLELEITESGVMAQGEQAVATLGALRESGVRLAIDDFGTGYSSLACLKQLPLDKLKIDRSFVGGLPEDANGTAIAATIIAMARTLGLKVLAEGVETQEQRSFFEREGCHYCQGYLFSAPLPAREFSRQFWKH